METLNTSFFSKAMTCPRARNLIKKIKTMDGLNVRTEKDISKHFYEYFLRDGDLVVYIVTLMN